MKKNTQRGLLKETLQELFVSLNEDDGERSNRPGARSTLDILRQTASTAGAPAGAASANPAPANVDAILERLKSTFRPNILTLSNDIRTNIRNTQAAAALVDRAQGPRGAAALSQILKTSVLDRVKNAGFSNYFHNLDTNYIQNELARDFGLDNLPFNIIASTAFVVGVFAAIVQDRNTIRIDEVANQVFGGLGNNIPPETLQKVDTAKRSWVALANEVKTSAARFDIQNIGTRDNMYIQWNQLLSRTTNRSARELSFQNIARFVYNPDAMREQQTPVPIALRGNFDEFFRNVVILFTFYSNKGKAPYQNLEDRALLQSIYNSYNKLNSPMAKIRMNMQNQLSTKPLNALMSDESAQDEIFSALTENDNEEALKKIKEVVKGWIQVGDMIRTDRGNQGNVSQADLERFTESLDPKRWQKLAKIIKD